jgi:translation initiation factor 3 subunit A
VALASEDLRNLYMWLEVEFQPLELCKRVETVTEPLIGSGSDLEGYVAPVREVTLARLIRQLSQIYETLEYKRLLELASYCKPFHMERVLVDLVRHNDMQVYNLNYILFFLQSLLKCYKYFTLIIFYIN